MILQGISEDYCVHFDKANVINDVRRHRQTYSCMIALRKSLRMHAHDSQRQMEECTDKHSSAQRRSSFHSDFPKCAYSLPTT